MKKRRMLYIFLCFIFTFFVLLMSSNFFSIKKIEIICYDSSNKQVNLNKEQIYINADCFYGKTILSDSLAEDKDVFEKNNSNFKLLNVKKIFPNKLVVNILKREPVFYISNGEKFFYLDEEFKILYIKNNIDFEEKMIEIRGEDSNYFDYFDIFSETCDEGTFLSSNNIAFCYLTNLFDTLTLFLDIDEIYSIFFVENDDLDLCFAFEESNGFKIVVKNIENQFDYKLNKVLNAYLTLKQKERIKSTYGKLIIDNSNNCKWVDD